MSSTTPLSQLVSTTCSTLNLMVSSLSGKSNIQKIKAVAIAVFAILAVGAIIKGSMLFSVICLGSALVATLSLIALIALQRPKMGNSATDKKTDTAVTSKPLTPFPNPDRGFVKGPYNLTIPEIIHWLHEAAKRKAANLDLLLNIDLDALAYDNRLSSKDQNLKALTVITEILKTDEFKDPETRDIDKLNELIEPLKLIEIQYYDFKPEPIRMPSQSFQFIDKKTLQIPLRMIPKPGEVEDLRQIGFTFNPDLPANSLTLMIQYGLTGEIVETFQVGGQ